MMKGETDTSATHIEKSVLHRHQLRIPHAIIFLAATTPIPSPTIPAPIDHFLSGSWILQAFW